MDDLGVLGTFDDLFMTVMIELLAASVAGLLPEVLRLHLSGAHSVRLEGVEHGLAAYSAAWANTYNAVYRYSGSPDCSDYAYVETLRRAQNNNRTAWRDPIFMQISAPRVS